MFEKEKIKKIVKNTLIADAYSLGAHWVYDEKQLANLDIDWQELNAPKAMWHKGKNAGDYTHIGDQAYWLYEFLQDKNKFEPLVYLNFWKERMDSYAGYIDGATRETLENIKNSKMIGSDSHDFSVIGRIAPLLLVSKDEEDFRRNVQEFVKLSHNNRVVLEAADFFARLLFEVDKTKNIEESMLNISKDYSNFIKNGVSNAIKSIDKNSFEVIRDFGPACDIDGGFPGIIHLVLKYQNNPKELLIQNAKAGGDSSSRAMPAILILSAYLNDL
ncbi:MAG: ADP-ribosylglycohydrolase family protein, partial [Epsilonproteobacteria bacterium]|nr:ADP-ribosylglycohydrolase family protein [Campylobacterota bacterium]